MKKPAGIPPTGFFNKQTPYLHIITYSMKFIHSLVCCLLCCLTAWAQNGDTGTVILKSPYEYKVLSISPNGKWACGTYTDYNSAQYGFRWNLESDEVELLDATNESQAWSVADNGTVAGQFSDTDYKANHAPIRVPGYYADGRWHRMELPDTKVSSGIAYSISPDGHYVAGSVEVGFDFLAFIWKDGKVHRQLTRSGIAMAYAVAPDGTTAAGWTYRDNRVACLWEADGSTTLLSNYQSFRSAANRFSADGKKLVFWGGYDTSDTSTPKLKCLYDMETKEVGTVECMDGGQSILAIKGISNNGIMVGEEANRAYINIGGKGQYMEDYLRELGIDLASLGIYVAENTDYYQLTVAQAISADGQVMAINYYNDDKDADGNPLVSLQTMIVKLAQNISSACPVGVKAEQLSDISTARIRWKAPLGARNIVGYNLYRDGMKLNSQPLAATSYIDEQLAQQDYHYTVTAVYGAEGGTTTESVASETATISIQPKGIEAPTAIYARQQGFTGAWLQWERPFSNLINKTYVNYDRLNLQSFGLQTENVAIECAIRFDADEVKAYEGCRLQRIHFYPMSRQDSWTLHVYTHGADGKLQELHTQPVTQQLVYGVKNEVQLTTPLALPAGDLIVSLEVRNAAGSSDIIGMDFGHADKGYSDLARVAGEDDFYSVTNAIEQEGVFYDFSWVMDAVFAPEDAATDIDEILHYAISADGQPMGTTQQLGFTLPQLTAGSHELGVSAVYSDQRQSAAATTALTISENTSLLQPVREVKIASTSASTVSASWQTPLDSDSTFITYAGNHPSTEGVMGPAENNYNLLASAIYTPQMLKGYVGYEIASFRFYPLSDAVYTLMLLKNGVQIAEVEADDIAINQWNTVRLTEPVTIEQGATYQLVIDCFDVAPEAYTIAVDTESPVTNYSDLYSEDGKSWSSITMAAIYGNWMMGMNLRMAEPMEMPVLGYDVRIDGEQKNSSLIADTRFDYSFTPEELDGKATHSLNVDVHYSATAIVKGGTTWFELNTSGIAANHVAHLSLQRGDNCLSVVGEGCQASSIELLATNGTRVAAAASGTLSLNHLATGVYVVRALVDGKSYLWKIVLE